MNNFSCSLSCSWMAIIDCLFYASDSLSRDVSWGNIAKLLVAWLYLTKMAIPCIEQSCLIAIIVCINDKNHQN